MTSWPARRSVFRIPPFLLLAAYLAVAATSASAGQNQAISESDGASYLRAEDHRVAAVVYRLGRAGAAFCAERLQLTGLLFHHLAEYSPADQPAAQTTMSLGHGMGVLAVMADSPAARAGLVAGDVLAAINDIPVPPPIVMTSLPSPRERRAAIAASESALEEQLRLGPVRLDVLREGRPLRLTLDSESGCPARGRLARSSQANAFADGRYAIMTTRFLRFFDNDTELAVAMAHELAHNILRHPAELDEQGVPTGFLRNIGRNARLVRATEEEADRLAVKLIWAAGYDVTAIVPFWRRLYNRLDSKLQLISAHPGFRARERIVNETIAQLPATIPQ